MFCKNSSKSPSLKLLYLALIPILLVALLAVWLFVPPIGYRGFINSYFDAIESGDKEQVLALYSWEYVENKNTENAKHKFTEMFYWDTLADYVGANDDCFDHFLGDDLDYQIEKVTSLDPANRGVSVRVYVTSSRDVVLQMSMAKKNGDWYMKSCFGHYADLEQEDE